VSFPSVPRASCGRLFPYLCFLSRAREVICSRSMHHACMHACTPGLLGSCSCHVQRHRHGARRQCSSGHDGPCSQQASACVLRELQVSRARAGAILRAGLPVRPTVFTLTRTVWNHEQLMDAELVPPGHVSNACRPSWLNAS